MAGFLLVFWLLLSLELQFLLLFLQVCTVKCTLAVHLEHTQKNPPFVQLLLLLLCFNFAMWTLSYHMCRKMWILLVIYYCTKLCLSPLLPFYFLFFIIFIVTHHSSVLYHVIRDTNSVYSPKLFNLQYK